MTFINGYFFKANELNSVHMDYVFGTKKSDAIKTLEEKMKNLKEINLQEKYLVVRYERHSKNSTTTWTLGFEFSESDYDKPVDEILDYIKESSRY